MILTDEDLLKILRDNPAKDTLAEARRQAMLMNTHITGENLKDVITLLDYFEDDQKKNLRQKYARSNRDLFARLNRPVDKVFRAKGGSAVYKMPLKAQQDFTNYIAGIRNGMNLRKWIQMVALPAFQIDPMGLIFVEVDTKVDPTGKQKPYPTYKSTGDIFDYKLTGRQVEYVIFKLSKSETSKFVSQGIDLPQQTSLKLLDRLGLSDNKSRYYRVVDDITDKIVEWDGGDAKPVELTDLTLMNPFMRVPAMIISDIVAYNSEQFISPDLNIVELANDYLTDVSVFNIWKKLHGFPKPWRYRSVCSACMGHGKLQGRDCPDCGGTGYRKNSTPRDEIIVPMPDDGGIKMPDKFGGYITPDIEGWSMMTDEMERLEKMMFYTKYGTHQTSKANGPQPSADGKTATETLTDMQSMIDRLDDYRQWGQTLEIFVTDLCGQCRYQTGYKGCSINWGNRFLLESPDTLWEKYKNARTAGAPQATLDGLLRDYYESEYATSPIDLEKAKKLMRVEPWTHLTPQQVGLLSTASQQDKICKTYFSEWISTMQDVDIVLADDEDLREQLVEYCQAKVDALQAEAEAAAQLAGTVTEDDSGGGVKGKKTLTETN